MAKLYFRYGAMNSGKSLDILKVAHNYSEKNRNILILTSSIDTRYGENIIASRAGLQHSAIPIKSDDNVYDIITCYMNISCVLIDEIQFFTIKHIQQLSDVVDILNIPVICYGLRSDFKMIPFPSSAYLFGIADEVEEIKTICEYCNKKATINARFHNNKITTEGEQILVGDICYKSLCRKCYKEKLK